MPRKTEKSTEQAGLQKGQPFVYNAHRKRRREKEREPSGPRDPPESPQNAAIGRRLQTAGGFSPLTGECIDEKVFDRDPALSGPDHRHGPRCAGRRQQLYRVYGCHRRPTGGPGPGPPDGQGPARQGIWRKQRLHPGRQEQLERCPAGHCGLSAAGPVYRRGHPHPHHRRLQRGRPHHRPAAGVCGPGGPQPGGRQPLPGHGEGGHHPARPVRRRLRHHRRHPEGPGGRPGQRHLLLCHV